MEEDRLLLTREERDRLKVMHETLEGHLTRKQAAQQLRLSVRQVRRLVRGLRKKGDRGVVHGLRGRPSNRKIAAATERKALAAVRRRYADFGPRLASEYLAKEQGIEVSRETLRQWMMAGGIWRSRRQRVEEVHLWRERRDCFGELVQWDMSDHDWLEGRGASRIYYVALIDDATSRAFARFLGHDSLVENLRLLWTYLEGFGRMVEVYTDWDSLFAVNHGRAAQAAREGWGERPKTQLGRALQELGIGWIGARSAQAKGRVERHFQVAQDRLVKGMRLAGVREIAGANQYLEQEFLPLWNERFTVLPSSPTDAHRPLLAQHELAAILSQVESRVVACDYTIRFEGRLYQIARAEVVTGLRRAPVRVEKRLDGTVAVRFRDRYLKVSECELRPKVLEGSAASGMRRQRSGGRYYDWNKGFDLKKSVPLWAAAQASGWRRELE